VRSFANRVRRVASMAGGPDMAAACQPSPAQGDAAAPPRHP
jgi:hypothetical protein